MSIFGLWITLYLVWAIFFLENFSLTRWQVSETWRMNFAVSDPVQMQVAGN